MNCDLVRELERCVKLYNSGVLAKDLWYAESIFIELLIRLNHVLQSRARLGTRIEKKPTKPSAGVKDITDLINTLRNAACHIGSGDRFLTNTKSKIIFNRFMGKGGRIIIGNHKIGGDYEDDVAFYYGNLCIYLYRDIGCLLKNLLEVCKKSV